MALLFVKSYLWTTITHLMGYWKVKGRGRENCLRTNLLHVWVPLFAFNHSLSKLQSSSLSDSDPEHRMAPCFWVDMLLTPGLNLFLSPRSSSQFQCQVLGFLNLFSFSFGIPRSGLGESQPLELLYSLNRTSQVLPGTPNCISVLSYKICLRKLVCPEIC